MHIGYAHVTIGYYEGGMVGQFVYVNGWEAESQVAVIRVASSRSFSSSSIDSES